VSVTAGGERASAPAPAALLALRIGLWALLLMVLAGLVAVWFLGPGGRARSRAAALPVMGQVPTFSLLERSGAAVDAGALAGRPWVAALIFTRCRISCPLLVQRLAKLDLPPAVRRVGISVDPVHDTPAVLGEYARQQGIDAEGWWLLTGDEGEVRRLAVEGFKLGVARTPEEDPRAADEPITHSTRLVLIDGDGAIRGYYDAFDEASASELERDAAALAVAGSGASGGARQ
jgi:protein SCO1/2